MATKNILICIDGTANDPSDALPHLQELQSDRSISNVLKLHLLARGKLTNNYTAEELNTAKQISLYYLGVGNNYDIKWKNRLSKVFAMFEPEKIIELAISDLKKYYNEGDTVYFFGFSRGAAIARKLAQKLTDDDSDKGSVNLSLRIKFLGLWDTVSVFDGKASQDPSELDEKEGKIAPIVDSACHLVAIDDPRKSFRPTLMGAENRVKEVWFTGVHSNVGGGYGDDGLSDITLQFMRNLAADLGVEFAELKEVDFNLLAPVEQRHIELAPNFEGTLHLAAVYDDKKYYAWIDMLKEILAPRDIRVQNAAGNDINNLPILHHTVVDRMNAMGAKYMPKSIKALDSYRIMKPDGSIEVHPPT